MVSAFLELGKVHYLADIDNGQCSQGIVNSLAREGPIIPLVNVTLALRIRKTN